jgi:hypothetical protein
MKSGEDLGKQGIIKPDGGWGGFEIRLSKRLIVDGNGDPEGHFDGF